LASHLMMGVDSSPVRSHCKKSRPPSAPESNRDRYLVTTRNDAGHAHARSRL